MLQQPYLSVVVPAYNEAGAIERTLREMRRYLDAQGYGYEVIVAADGDDATPKIVTEVATTWPSLSLSYAPGRHGKGHGLRRGMALAHGQIVGFVDADYKTRIEELDRLLPALREGYDIAIGSRGLAESRIQRRQPWYRQIGSRGFAVLMHTLVGLPAIRDTQCGFKFFTAEAAHAIFPRTRIDGYMCDVEVLTLAERLGHRVKEIGVAWADDGDSRLELVRGNLKNVADLLQIRFGLSHAPERRAKPVPTLPAGS